MRKGILGSVAAMLAGAGLAFAQAPAPRGTATISKEPPLFAVGQAPAAPKPVQVNPLPSTEKAPAPSKDVKHLLVTPPPAHGKMDDKTKIVSAAACLPCDPCLPACCEVCGPPGKYWVSAEYLLWWMKTGQTPELVTTSPSTSFGILGQPGTRALIGGRGLDRDPHHGARFTAGMWLDCCQTKGFEIGYFFLANRSTECSAGGDGTATSATVARPFLDATTGRENSQLVSFPNVLAGTATVRSTARLQGVTPNALCNLCCCSPTDCCDPRGYRVDLLVGPRFYNLEEDVSIREDLRVANSVAVLGGSRINIRDVFDTENRFYGGFVGGRAEYWMDKWFANATGGIALGSTNQVVRINGNTVITPPTGAVVSRSGGLLTQRTNIGRYSRNEFTYIPEVNFNVGYQVTENLRAYVGYTLIWWSDVVRPGDQIDRVVNPTQLPTLGGQGTLVGPARPTFQFNDSSFWTQGLNVGLQLRF